MLACTEECARLMLVFRCSPVVVDASIAWLGKCKTEDRGEGELLADIVALDVVAATGDDCS